MGKVRLREAPQAGGHGQTAVEGMTVQPLRIAGLMVTKAALIAALQLYVPGLTDLLVTEDEHFWLVLNEGGRSEDPAAR